MESEIFVHYGSKKFDKNLFESIKNQYFVKPQGGLWASSVNAKYGWKDWNEYSGFRKCQEENSFKFRLKENAKVCIINKIEELRSLPENGAYKNEEYKNVLSRSVIKDIKCLDFEKLVTMGYDAILVNISSDQRLYWALYGWDCDSLLVFNKEIIEEVKDEINND